MSARYAPVDEEGEGEEDEDEGVRKGKNLEGKFAAVSGASPEEDEDDDEEEEEGEEAEDEEDEEEDGEEEDDDEDDDVDEEEEEEEEDVRPVRKGPKKTVSIASPVPQRDDDDAYGEYSSPKSRASRFPLHNPFRGGHIQGRSGGGIARGRLVASQEPSQDGSPRGLGSSGLSAMGTHQVAPRIDTKQSEMILKKQLDTAVRKLYYMSRQNESLLNRIDASESLPVMERLRGRLAELEALVETLQSENHLLSDVSRKQERMLQEFTREVAEDRLPDISALSEVRQLKSRISNLKLILNETRQREKKALTRVEALKKRLRKVKRKNGRKGKGKGEAAEGGSEGEAEGGQGAAGAGKRQPSGKTASTLESHTKAAAGRSGSSVPPGFGRSKRDAIVSVTKSGSPPSGSSKAASAPGGGRVSFLSNIGGERSFKSILASMSGVHQANQILHLKAELYKVHQEKEALNEELLEKDRLLQSQVTVMS
jgi:hypothetical protein